MDYFFSADVGKKNCVVAGCDAEENPVIRCHSVPNRRNGFARLVQRLRALAAHADQMHFLVEASGSLHENFIHYLAAHVPSLHIYVVNPLVSKRYGTHALRRNHTDPDDTAHLLQLIVREWRNLHRWKGDETLESLRRLVAERHRLVKDRTREINRLHSRLDVTFPEFTDIFRDLTQCQPIAVLQAYPTPAHLCRRRVATLARFRASGRGCHPLGTARAERLIATARLSTASATTDVDAELVRMGAERLEALHRQILACERLIRSLLTEVADNAADPATEPPTSQAVLAHQAELAQTLPAIGPTISACLCARAGDINQYKNGNALGAFLGTCPARHQTGSSRDDAHLTPYGPKTFRSSLYLGTLNAIETFLPLKFYYLRLRDPHRRNRHGRRHALTHKQAVVACMNRIVHWLYAVVTSDTPFDPQRIYDNCQRHFAQEWQDFLEQPARATKGASP